MLDYEKQLSGQYATAGNALISAIIHNPSSASALLGPYLQLYKELQGKLEETSDQLGKSAQDAELGRGQERGARHPHHVCDVRDIASSAIGPGLVRDPQHYGCGYQGEVSRCRGGPRSGARKAGGEELTQKVDSILTVVAAATQGDLTQEISVQRQRCHRANGRRAGKILRRSAPKH